MNKYPETYPFDLAKALLQNAEVCTRDGRVVSDIKVIDALGTDEYVEHYQSQCRSVRGIYATIHNTYGRCEYPFYNNGGAHRYGNTTGADLRMVKP